MPRIAMLGRFQPVHLVHEDSIKKAQQYGDVCVGIYCAPRSSYNPFTPDEVERMLNNALSGIETFRFIPTLNPRRFRNQLTYGAGTEIVYTTSRRTAILMSALNLDAIYERRKELSASEIRKMVAKGDETWKSLVHEANIGIISGVELPGHPNFFRRRMVKSLYKHGFM